MWYSIRYFLKTLWGVFLDLICGFIVDVCNFFKQDNQHLRENYRIVAKTNALGEVTYEPKKKIVLSGVECWVSVFDSEYSWRITKKSALRLIKKEFKRDMLEKKRQTIVATKIIDFN